MNDDARLPHTSSFMRHRSYLTCFDRSNGRVSRFGALLYRLQAADLIVPKAGTGAGRQPGENDARR